MGGHRGPKRPRGRGQRGEGLGTLLNSNLFIKKNDILYSNVELIFESRRAWGGPGGLGVGR